MTGYFFEDFYIGQNFNHATPRTITEGDIATYNSLYGMRYALQAALPVAEQFGHRNIPIDEFLVFHLIFGKTVPDISYNAIANLGYAQGIFYKTIYKGTTIYAKSQVIGLKQNSSGKNGIVYVKSHGFDQNQNRIFTYIRWVMVRKSDLNAKTPQTHIPKIDKIINAENLQYKLPEIRSETPGYILGSDKFYHDYKIGDVIIHPSGQTVENAEHMMAARLYQNPARVHFDKMLQQKHKMPDRIVYGGHVISIVRSICFDGLENLLHIAGINSGTHNAPLFAGDTVYSYSKIIDKTEKSAAGNKWGALRLQSVGLKNIEPREYLQAKDEHKSNLILELDYWGYMPIR